MSLKSQLGNTSLQSLLLPALVVLLIASSFAIGVLWTKVSYLEKGAPAATTATPAAGAGQAAAPEAATVDINKIKELFDKDLIKFGDKNRKVLFVEIADPSCPYCHVAGGKNPELAKQVGTRFQYASDGGSYLPPVPEMKKLVDSGKASYIYIYSNGHGNGEMGTKALYCAQEQGKYWQAHDLLYTNAGYELLNNTIKNDKAQAGALSDFLKGAADSGKLKSCLESGKYDDRISTDQALASSLGISGTPGFFVNSTIYRGAYGFTDMKTVVDAVLK
ncbi:MAG: DsbA family protein [bacterium]|nr:DsbA family protein [bacterium]